MCGGACGHLHEGQRQAGNSSNKPGGLTPGAGITVTRPIPPQLVQTALTDTHLPR